MTKFFLRYLARLVCSEPVWHMLPEVLRRSVYLQVQRGVQSQKIRNQAASALLEGGVVVGGPFAGMQVSNWITRGSAHFPRFLGSYESELHDEMTAFASREYQILMDIGFAEGYYLVGLALMNRSARIIGFDCDSIAHTQCRELASANGIDSDRLEFHGTFTHELAKKSLPARSLVICDCEGFELSVFDKIYQNLWSESDLIIECHDFISEGVSNTIISNLQQTHKIRIVESVEPQDKLHFTNIPALSRLTLTQRKYLLDEGRPAKQIWIIAEAKI
jgi:hypothetical protein